MILPSLELTAGRLRERAAVRRFSVCLQEKLFGFTMPVFRRNSHIKEASEGG